MKLIRFLFDGEEQFGAVENDVIRIAEGNMFSDFTVGNQTVPLAQVKILPPSQPSKIVAVGLNYREHSEEFGETVPEEPKLFLKPPSAVIAHGEAIVRPPQSERVDYEAELALVIGRRCSKISAADAEQYILGYTCLNDVTARDLQSKDGQWTRAKSFDTFAPIGPWIETETDPNHLDIRLLKNGMVMQSANTSQFIFPVETLVSYISHVMTLLPGDVITTGTPCGVGPMQAGDTVTVSISGIGDLTNPVV